MTGGRVFPVRQHFGEDCMKLLNDIFLVCGPVYGSHQNVYAIRNRESITLIDTGKNEHDYGIICNTLQYWGLDRYPIKTVLLTHEHYEHCANAWRFQKKGAIIVSTENAAKAISAGDDRVAAYAHAFMPPFKPVAVDRTVLDYENITVGDILFTCVQTPGHCAGNAVYFAEINGRLVLFAGDTIIPQILCNKTRMGWTGALDYDRNQVIESIEKLNRHPGKVDILLAGHGELCLWNAQRMVHDALVQARLTLKHGAVSEPVSEV